MKEITAKLRAESRERWATVRRIRDPQQRLPKTNGADDDFDAKARELLSEVLSPEQMMRLDQIEIQVRGPLDAFNNPRVAQHLQLTDEQKQKAADLREAMQEKTREASQGLRDVPEDQRWAKMEELRRARGKILAEGDEQALGLLTPEQKSLLAQLEGSRLER